MLNQKLRFVLVVPYLMLTTVLLAKAHFFPYYSTLLLSVSDLFLLMLVTPWIFLFSAVVQSFGLEGILVDYLVKVGSVTANAAILYYMGLKFERAPDSLFH